MFIYYLLYLPFLFLLLVCYLKIARFFNITDKPNLRSSHKEVTIRGAGVIFPVSVLLYGLISGLEFPLFCLGLLLIASISFLDDIYTLPNKIRILIQVLSVSLMLIEVDLMQSPLWLILAAYVVIIGTINAWNFMDGINGITGGYGLVIILSLYFVNEFVFRFIDSGWLIAPAAALLAFNFFNFRAKAKCFAGDVGSVSIAFIIVFFLLQLITKSSDIKYLIFMLLYGLDTITTILFRLIRKENIFMAHRSHFYQFLTNTKGWPHLYVSALYIFIQFFINLFVISFEFTPIAFGSCLLISGMLFTLLRLKVEGKNYLLSRVNSKD